MKTKQKTEVIQYKVRTKGQQKDALIPYIFLKLALQATKRLEKKSYRIEI